MNIVDISALASPEELTQWWAELGQDEQSPDYYELTEYGELVWYPRAGNDHQRLCTQMAFQVQTQLGGQAVHAVAVLTHIAGVRVPDVVWMPEEKWEVLLAANDLIHAPDLVVEILAPDDRATAINHKIHGYLQSGVKEVIVVGLTGTIEYIHPDGRHATSIFPLQLKLPAGLFT